MVRRLKPEKKLTRLGKWRRKRNITHPESYEKRKKERGYWCKWKVLDI